jgi:hypothetical protein
MMTDENMFGFINAKKARELTDLKMIDEKEFLENVKGIMGAIPFRFEVMGLHRPEVLACVKYLQDKIERFYGDTTECCTPRFAIYVVDSNILNKISVGVNTTAYSTYEMILDRDLNVRPIFALELLSYNKIDKKSRWVVYDRFYTLLYEVELNIGYVATEDLNNLLKSACLPKNHF